MHLTRSKHLPYTTLFRSNPDQIDSVFDAFEEIGVNLLDDDFDEEPDIDDLKEVEDLKIEDFTESSFEGVSVDDPVRMYLREIGRDRKSTRLNSSHVSISY